jgi:hypothetical protein
MKKRLTYNMLIIFLLSISINSLDADAGSIPSAQIQGSPIYRFTQWLSKQYDATYADAKFLWEYGTKKIHGKKIKKKETRRAKSIAKKIGITLIGIGAVVAAFLGVRVLLRNGTFSRKPEHPASSEEEVRGQSEKAEKIVSLIEAIESGDRQAALSLIEQGADVNKDDSERCYPRLGTPLTVAVEKGDIGLVRELLDRGADPNHQESSRGYTPLMIAALSGSTDIAQLLLARGADPNVDGRGGYFPLYEAVWMANKEMVELLLQRGADVNKKTLREKTALDKAIFPLLFHKDRFSREGIINQEKIVGLLLDAGADEPTIPKSFLDKLRYKIFLRSEATQKLPVDIRGEIFEWVTEKPLSAKQKERIRRRKSTSVDED